MIFEISAQVQSGSPGRFGIWTDAPPEQFNQAIDRLRVASANIVALSFNGCLSRGQKGPCYVGNIEEVAALCAVADHGERHSSQFLAKEYAKYRAIGACRSRPRTVCVENADRIHRQPVDAIQCITDCSPRNLLSA